MDDIYLEVLSAGDIPRAKTRAMESVVESLEALDRLMSERRWRRLLGSIKVDFSLTKLGIGVLAGLQAGQGVGLPLVGAVVGAAVCALNVNLSLLRSPVAIPKDLKAYAYLHQLTKEFP